MFHSEIHQIMEVKWVANQSIKCVFSHFIIIKISLPKHSVIRHQFIYKGPLVCRYIACIYIYSVSHTLIYLWRPATISTSTATNTHRPLPSAPAFLTHEHNFSTIFSNFQTLLAAFFHKRYILTNLSTFFEKP